MSKKEKKMPCKLGSKTGKAPYLSHKKIDEEVEKNRSGVYGLDRGPKDAPFKVYYVGRADEDLNGRLKDHVDEEFGGSKYKWFKYDYVDNAHDAYYKECECYHHYGEKEKLDNDVHPKKPEGTNLKCPVCGN